MRADCGRATSSRETSQGNLSLIEAGRRAAAPSTQERLAAQLCCCIGDIFRVESLEYLTVKQAADLIGVDPRTILRRTETGELRLERRSTRESALASEPVVAMALAAGRELWSLSSFARELGQDAGTVHRAFTRHAVVTLRGAISTPRGTRESLVAPVGDGLDLLTALLQKPAACLRCVEGRCDSIGATYCRGCRARIRGETRAAAVSADPSLVARGWATFVGTRCFVCGCPMERPAWQVRKAHEERRRQVCEFCLPAWKAALIGGRTPVKRARTRSEALDVGLRIGSEAAAEIAAARPPSFGRRPRPIALDIAIELLYVTRGVPDVEIRDLLVRARKDVEVLERFVPADPNARYVTRRREQGLIRRREQRPAISV